MITETTTRAELIRSAQSAISVARTLVDLLNQFDADALAWKPTAQRLRLVDYALREAHRTGKPPEPEPGWYTAT